MKKAFFLLSFLSFLFFAGNLLFCRDYSHSEEYFSEVPPLLQGVWQGKDRLLLFCRDGSPFACVLRVFYSWYDDRAAEGEEYAQILSRDRNNTTAPRPENISIEFKTIVENSSKTSGAYELKIKYPALKDYVYIPLAVVEGKIYLNFLVREDFEEETEENSRKTETFFLKDFSAASGITISPPVIKKELLSYVADGQNVYPVRYWLSGMEENDGRAELYDGEITFSIPKFLQAAGNLYTCTTGLSSKIRNVKKTEGFPVDFVTDEEKKIYAFGTEYLVYVPGTGNYQQILESVRKDNQRRHPPSKPIFPVTEPKFRWKEISDIELYDIRTWNRRNLDIHK